MDYKAIKKALEKMGPLYTPIDVKIELPNLPEGILQRPWGQPEPTAGQGGVRNAPNHEAPAEGHIQLPAGIEWIITSAVNGGGAGNGLFLIPRHWESQRWLDVGSHCGGFPPIENRKIIFELFRLTNSGTVKLSARCRYMNGAVPFPSFVRLETLARALGCPAPRPGRATATKSVAAWPEEQERPVFTATDYTGIANWLREFLAKPPEDFVRFITIAPYVL